MLDCDVSATCPARAVRDGVHSTLNVLARPITQDRVFCGGVSWFALEVWCAVWHKIKFERCPLDRFDVAVSRNMEDRSVLLSQCFELGYPLLEQWIVSDGRVVNVVPCETAFLGWWE